MKYYLAIDQGTHASRACLFDETGKLVCKHTKKIKLRRISNSNVEQDANEIVNSVKQVIKKLLHETGNPDSIVACGIAIQRSSVVAWLKDGTAISPVLSWQDTRAKAQLVNLEKHEAEIQQLSGLPLSAHYGASKLHYLLEQANSRNMPMDKLRLSPLISYLLFHILDDSPYIVDHSNAQRTQLFDLAELNWSRRLTELFNVPMQLLPDCVPVLKISESANEKLAHGKLAGTEIPVCAISGDQNAAIFGGGLLPPETALVNFGTGAFALRLLSHYRASDKQLSGIACSDYNTVQYVREATINGAASALTWLENKAQVSDVWPHDVWPHDVWPHDVLPRDVLQQLPGWLNKIKQPPVFINTIGGLGSPWWVSGIEAKFIATDGSSHKAKAEAEAEPDMAVTDLAKQAVAIIESIVFMVCINLEIMQSEKVLSRLRVSGGLSQLDGLCQDLANLSALPVERLNLTEATARGVAWLAAGKPDDWSSVELEMFKPANKPALTERYSLFSATLKRVIH